MASNPYVNKVIYGNQTVIDLTMDTLTASKLEAGATAHDRSGAPITGTGVYYSPNDAAETALDDADYVPFYDSSATAKKNSLWSNIKTKLKEYFDTFYQTILTFDTYATQYSSNPVESNGLYQELAGKDALISDTVGFLNKNFLHVDSTVVNTTSNGFSFSINRNSEGEVVSIDISGSATDPTAETVLWLGDFFHSPYNLPDGNYILSGGLSDDIFLRLTGGYSNVLEQKGTEVTFVKNWQSTQDWQNVYLVVKNPNISWRERVYPMIRKSTVRTNTFYPYHLDTAKSLIDDKVITLTKAQYDALSTDEKNDPDKVYYVTDYDPVPVYAELDDSATAANKVWSSQKVNTQKADNSVIAPVENGTTASRAYAVGEHFIRDGAFCTAKTAIASGAAFTLNTNYTAGTVGESIEDINLNGLNQILLKDRYYTDTFNIDTIDIPNGYIYRLQIRGTSLGTQPELNCNGYLLFGFSIIASGTSLPIYGVQMAIGFGADKIAIRHTLYNASGAAWGSWKYLTAT